MFAYDRYIRRPGAVARHRNGPHAAERDRYLSALEAEGRAAGTMVLAIAHLRFAAARLDLAGGRRLSRREVAVQLRRAWLGRSHASRTASRACRERAWRVFLHRVTDWLRFAGRFRDPPPPVEPAFEPLVRQYLAFHRDERGLAAATLRNLGETARAFLRHLGERGRPLSSAAAADAASYLDALRDRGWARSSLARAGLCLRGFLRYAAGRGWCPPGIDAAVPVPRLYAHATLPQGPAWEQVRALVASADGLGDKDVRDRAVLLLLATYGLRAGEVAALRLDDVDWAAGVIRPRRPKGRRTGTYPLAGPVGDAILRYLRQVRPAGCACRGLFVTRMRPHRPVGPRTITTMVRDRQLQLGQRLRRYGAHGLRHACATRLLAEGFTLKQVGDQLGHASAAATGIYAKVDLAALREVGEVDLAALARHDRQCAAREAGLWPRGSLEALREVADVPLRGLFSPGSGRRRRS